MSLLLALLGGSSSFVITPSGTVVLSGGSSFIRTEVISTQGGALFSGVSSFSKQKVYITSGTVAFLGTGSIVTTDVPGEGLSWRTLMGMGQ